MADLLAHVLVEGLGMVESVRWRDGAVYVADWTGGVVHRVDPSSGADSIVLQHKSLPLCFDFTGDGELLVASGSAQGVLALDDRGVLETRADLSGLARGAWNEILAGPDGRVWVNAGNFDPAGGFPTPGSRSGLVVCVEEGGARVVAEGLDFPNGMALTPAGDELVVAESYANCLTAFTIAPDGSLGPGRVWAATVGLHPDGIAMARDGRCWIADVGSACAVLVAEGGEQVRRLDTGDGAFSCALDDVGERLFVATADWAGGRAFADPSHDWRGRLLAFDLA